MGCRCLGKRWRVSTGSITFFLVPTDVRLRKNIFVPLPENDKYFLNSIRKKRRKKAEAERKSGYFSFRERYPLIILIIKPLNQNFKEYPNFFRFIPRVVSYMTLFGRHKTNHPNAEWQHFSIKRQDKHNPLSQAAPLICKPSGNPKNHLCRMGISTRQYSSFLFYKIRFRFTMTINIAQASYFSQSSINQINTLKIGG